MYRVDGTNLKLKAVLSLYFGDFSSKEYISYHFEDVNYNVLTATLTFDQPDQDVTVQSTLFDTQKLQADVVSTTTGFIGQLILERNGTSSPTNPIVESLAGEYQGFCDGENVLLHLLTYRTSRESARVSNPFGAYEIRGNVGSTANQVCSAPSGSYCTTDIIKSGTYDFFKGRATLFGKILQYDCNVNGNHIDCGRCQFQKSSVIFNGGAAHKPLLSENLIIQNNANPAQPSSSNSTIKGEYVGYLHHERLNQYQRGSLSISTYQDSEGALTMSAVGRLAFGNPSSKDVLSYKFNPTKYNLLSPIFVFEAMADDVDAVLQIVSLGNGSVKGVWYSIQFGRVGTFEFVQSGLQPLPPNTVALNSVAGVYTTEYSELFLDSRLDTAPVNTLNPFFPLVFGGFLSHPGGLFPRVEVVGGSYDFYTGRIGIELEQENQVLIGEYINTQNLLWLNKPVSDLLRIQQPFEPKTYRRVQ
jgi:hypothetical protein